jgi:hypothetical protein
MSTVQNNTQTISMRPSLSDHMHYKNNGNPLMNNNYDFFLKLHRAKNSHNINIIQEIDKKMEEMKKIQYPKRSGCVYCMSKNKNKFIIKIGYTNDLDRRLSELGYDYEWHIDTDYHEQLESLVHLFFNYANLESSDEYNGIEWFNINLNDAITIISLLKDKIEYEQTNVFN